MHIHKIEIKNIRSLSHVVMTFPNPAGWHVVIGDNGLGKSSLLRAIAIGIIHTSDIFTLQLPLQDWVQKNKKEGIIELQLSYETRKKVPPIVLKIQRPITAVSSLLFPENNYYIESKTHKNNGFSASFGAFRRFTGGDKKWSDFYDNSSSSVPHLSLFHEGAALSKSLDWLIMLQFKSFEKDELAIHILATLKKFINGSDLLPASIQFSGITSKGILFNYMNSNEINITELSDGFRSLLSLVFELIRQLINYYGIQVVFEPVLNGTIRIETPGVVMIDEIDAHLHPTWQTRIGQWFTKHFPNIQFIVATHSPLICRACEKGSIWRLTNTPNGTEMTEITGIDKEKLIYGNILDAYGTEIFGESPVRSEKSDEKLKRLGYLNMRAAFGKITEAEEKERLNLQQILQTDDAIN